MLTLSKKQIKIVAALLPATAAILLSFYFLAEHLPQDRGSSAVAYMDRLGHGLVQEIENTTRDAMIQTNRIATDKRVAPLIASKDPEALKDAANEWISDIPGLDVISFFDQDGTLLAMNTIDESGRPFALERIAKLFRMNFENRPIVQQCLRNQSATPLIEFQTQCDFTPALFDSSGLSVALSSPVSDEQGRRVGAVSTRLNFRRIRDHVIRTRYSDMGTDVFLVSRSGNYFSEAINSGKEPPPVPPDEVKKLIDEMESGGVSTLNRQQAEDYIGVYSIGLKEVMQQGKIYVFVRSPVAWVDGRAHRGQKFVIPLFLVLGVAVFFFAAAFWSTVRQFKVTAREGIRMGRSAIIPCVAFVALLISSLLLWRITDAQMQQRLFMQFRHDTHEIKSELEKEIQSYADLLYAGQALFAASQSVDPEEWTHFFKNMDIQRRHSGLNLIRFIERMPDQKLSVKYSSPDHSLKAVLSEDSVYLAAAERAVTMNSTMTVRVPAPEGADLRGAWFEMLLPIYANGAPIATAEQRLSANTGFIGAVFSVETMVAGAIKIPDLIRFRIHGPAAGAAVYLSHAGEDFSDANPDRLMYEEAIHISCCTWKLRFETLPGYRLEAVQRNFPLFVLFGSLVVSVLVFGFLIAFSTSRYRAQLLALSMTYDLQKQTEIAEEARRRAEAASKVYRESEERNRLIIQTAMDGVVTLSSSGIITGWNPQAAGMFGWKNEEIIGKKFTQTILAPSFQMIFDSMIRRYMDSGTLGDLQKHLEIRVVHRQGFEFPAEINVCPIVLSGETMFSAFVRDITERQAAEKAIRESESRQKAILHGIPDIAWLKDKESRFIAVNPALASKAGMSLEDIVGKTDLDLWPKELAEHYRADDREVMREGKEKRIEERLIGKDGVEMWIETIKMPFRNDRGEVVGTAGIARDMTERKRSEIALIQANEELKSTQLQLIQVAKMESVGRLAAGVAHEVKNPLAIIQMGVDYLRTTSAESEAGGVLNDMRDAVKRADKVIRGLLDFSVTRTLEAGAHDLHEVIDRALTLVRHDLIKHRVTVEKEFATSLPRLLLDPNKIEQVYINLFMNAAQAMELTGGVILVRTYVENVSPGRSRVVCEVDDTGPGILDNKIEKVFDPFFTTKPTGKGTGLGLTVTKKIIELHGGTIHMTNRPEGGARVRLVFSAQAGGKKGT